MFFDVLFVLKRDLLLHKLRYSKTLKGDLGGAFLGMCSGLFVGYLSLSMSGTCSIDLSDLTTLVSYCLSIVITIRLKPLLRSSWKRVVLAYMCLVLKFLD